MMDELKAYIMIMAISVRLFLTYSHSAEGNAEFYLLCGLGTLVAFASAISLTRFVRSAEYAQATGQPQAKHGQSAGKHLGRIPAI